jgi:sigma-54 dependent transcriptional regulator, acetoin dehydrogenase operon transcriptional activator AcoR
VRHRAAGARIAGIPLPECRSVASPRTVTRTVERRKGAPRSEPFLFLVLRCDRPAGSGARFSLAGAETVTVGRAEALSARRDGERLQIGIPDPGLSTEHLRLHRVLGAFLVEDAGSKNGTLLDGLKVDQHPIGDGGLIEAGHSFILFRDALPPADDLLEVRADAPGLATFHPALAAELERVRRVARSGLGVLLRGESGTGKGVLAAAIHRLSGRRGPFVPVNCGAIAPGVLESELFGHRRGAFTGAVADQAGLVRAADGGTLLLDEVGDLPPPAQAALLRVLQEGEVVPVGASQPIKVDLRVIAATHRDLEGMAALEKFRPDLLARLSGYSLTLPPLRERREDFSLLVADVLARLGAAGTSLSAAAARALLRYPWPLNLRELEKCLSAAVVLAGGGKVEIDHLPRAVLEPAPRPHAETRDDGRARELAALLQEHEGNVSAVARSLGKARTQVQRWLRRYRLDPLAFRK